MGILKVRGNEKKRKLPWSGLVFDSKEKLSLTCPQRFPPSPRLASTRTQQAEAHTTVPAMTSSHLRTPPPEQMSSLPGPYSTNGVVRSAGRGQRKSKNASLSSRKPRHVPVVDIRPKPSRKNSNSPTKSQILTTSFHHQIKQNLPPAFLPKFEPTVFNDTSYGFDQAIEGNFDSLYLLEPVSLLINFCFIPAFLPHHETHLGYYYPSSVEGDLGGMPQDMSTWQPERAVPEAAAQMPVMPSYGPPAESPYDFEQDYQQQPQHQGPGAAESSAAGLEASAWQDAISRSGLFDHTPFGPQHWPTYNAVSGFTATGGAGLAGPLNFTSWAHQQPMPAASLSHAQARTPSLASFAHEAAQIQTPPGTATTHHTVSPRDVFNHDFLPPAPLRASSHRLTSEDEPMTNTPPLEQSRLYRRGRGQIDTAQQPQIHRPPSTSSFASMLRANERLMEASEDGSVSDASASAVGGFASSNNSSSRESARRQLPNEPRSSRARFAYLPSDDRPGREEDENDDDDDDQESLLHPHATTRPRTSAQAEQTTESSQPSHAQGSGPAGPPTENFPSGRLPAGASSAVENLFIHEMREEGLSFREIQAAGPFVQAESTLRGRYRTYVTDKALRPRKAEWTAADDVFLWDAVRHYRRVGRHSRSDQIPWQKVRDYVFEAGGTHKFWSASCHKRWKMLRDRKLRERVGGGGDVGDPKDTKAGYSLDIYGSE
ncbi:hypothetical protein PpBr36_08892 [Pyricularia pennisetigena]|uniref:hypothetical protein n=1 Tax=Pyricularia pennisetigena TaxID=1578925 RepID=UPI001151179C|nr:hypothetical protein PpBr36_08892 [Pyricularia pennisetigena]TLS23912.1 hypothetical protein PpBr36_08892 [Pyricularia pennisetigena]